MQNDHKTLIATLVTTCLMGASYGEQPAVINIAPVDDSHVLYATVPKFDNQWFAMVMPKTVAERRMSMINAPSTRHDWIVEEDGTVRTTFTPGILINYTMTMKPTADVIDARLTVTNQTDYQWENVWFFTFLAPHGAEEFKIENGGTVYFPTSKGVVSSQDLSREGNVHEEMAVLLAGQITRENEPHFLRNLACTIEPRAAESWMIGMNKDNNRWFAMAAPEAVFLFTNDDLSSIHVAPNFGDLDPLETSEVSIRFRFGEGSLEEAIAQMQQDVEELCTMKNPSQPASLLPCQGEDE